MQDARVELLKDSKKFNIKFCATNQQYGIFLDSWALRDCDVGREVINVHFKSEADCVQISPTVVDIKGRIGLELLKERVNIDEFDKELFFDLIDKLQKKSIAPTSYSDILEKYSGCGSTDLIKDLLGSPRLKELLIKERSFGLVHGDPGLWNLYQKNGRYFLIDWEFCTDVSSQFFDVIYFSLSTEVLFNKCSDPEVLLGRIVLFTLEFFNRQNLHIDNEGDLIYVELVATYALLQGRHDPEDILATKLAEVIEILRKRLSFCDDC